MPSSDCNINIDKFSKYANAELANILGNLYQRCLPFNIDLIYPSYSEIESVLNDQDREMIKRLDQVRLECNKEYEIFNFYNGLNQIMTSLRLINNMIQEYKPWDLVKENKLDLNLKKLLFFVYESLRIAGILLQPITPDLANELLDRLNTKHEERFFEFAIVNQQQKSNSTVNIKSNKNVLFKKLI